MQNIQKAATERRSTLTTNDTPDLLLKQLSTMTKQPSITWKKAGKPAINNFNIENSFANYAITEKNSRAGLRATIDDCLSALKAKKPFAIDAAGNLVAITQLLHSNKKVDYDDIVIAIIADKTVGDIKFFDDIELTEILLVKLKYLDEATWIRLALLFDQCQLSDQDINLCKTSLYTAISNFITESNTETSAEQRVYAFLILKSQDQCNTLQLSDDFYHALNTYITDNTIFYRIFTTLHDYSNASGTIASLFNDTEFNVEEYYTSASSQFKQLNETAVAMQLAYYARHESVDTAILTQVRDLHSHLQNDLSAYENNVTFVKSRFALQILDEEQRQKDSIIERAFQGHRLTGKNVTTPFLRAILKHLIQYGTLDNEHTNCPFAPFIWSIYTEAYLAIKSTKKRTSLTEGELSFSSEKLNDINIWLAEQLFTESNQDFKKTLLTLPVPLRKILFGFANSVVDPNTLLTYSVKRRSSLPALFSRTKEETLQNVTMLSSGPTKESADVLSKYTNLKPAGAFQRSAPKDNTSPETSSEWTKICEINTTQISAIFARKAEEAKQHAKVEIPIPTPTQPGNK